MKSTLVYRPNDQRIQQIVSYPEKKTFIEGAGILFGDSNQRFFLDAHLSTPSQNLKDPKLIRTFPSQGFGQTYIQDGSHKEVIYEGADARDLDIVLEGMFHVNTGYALLTREFGKRFLESDFPVRFLKDELYFNQYNCLTDKQVKWFHDRRIDPKEYYGSGKDFISLGFHHPFINFHRQKYNIVYTMIESYSLNTMYWQQMDGCYDRFLVPTQFVKDVFSQYIEEERIDVVPLGVDLSILNPGIPKHQEVLFKKADGSKEIFEFTHDKPSGFNFLYMGRFSHRKGSDLVLKAFCEAFTAKDDVSLILFCIPEIYSHLNKLHTDIRNLVNKYSGKKLPPIYLVDYTFPEATKSLPFSWGDCFVFPSRGEGFGLPPLEAGACGLPLICADNTGLADFIDDSVATVIPCDKIDSIGSCFRGEYKGEYPEWRHDCFFQHMNHAHFPIMNSPAVISDLAEKMKYVYENSSSEEIQNKKENMLRRILEKYTWDLNYEKFLSSVKRIVGR